MEPPGGLPPDKDKSIVYQQPNINITTSSIQHQHPQDLSLINVSTATSQQSLEKLSRPAAFDKMESLVKEMQDPENGVPVRQQKMFLTSIPYAFMGYDLIEWLMDRLSIEESEALSIANQLCLHGYFFPVNDTKSLVVKDDSSLYRFQTPYYWPWQHKAPDNVEYAIYLCKRSLRNKQRHGLEDYESDALASLHKNLKGKWDFISMQAEEQVRLAKERKKGDKIVGDSQERAYWRVHRPPPGQFTPLEPCPVPSRDRQGFKPKKRTSDDWQREVDYLRKSLGRTRMKMSQVCESLVNYWETFAEYDFFQQPVLPSNPWVSEDTTFWQLNNAIVDLPTEKRVKRWGISIEELVSDPTGLQEFTTFLEKEYSHENIRFWIAVNKLRRSAHSQVARKVNEIYEEFLKPGAPCEINIDSKTMETVQKGLKNPSRFTFDAAAEHIYMLLLKKDCYPRFIRSDHYKTLLASGIQPSHKKRFFGFGGVAKKKSSTAVPTIQSSQGLLLSMQASSSSGGIVPPPGGLSRRRGSDRSLTGSAHELAVIGVKDSVATMTTANKVPHSHSQSNLSEIPYRVTVYRGDMPMEEQIEQESSSLIRRDQAYPSSSSSSVQETGTKLLTEKLEITAETIGACAVCPWETSSITDATGTKQSEIESSVCLAVCPWDDNSSKPKETAISDTIKIDTTAAGNIQKQSSSSDVLEVSERMRRSCGLRQHTVDSDYQSGKRLMPHAVEQRRASMTVEPRLFDYEMTSTTSSKQIVTQTRSSITPSPTEFSGTRIKEQIPLSDTIKKFTATSSSNNGNNNDNGQSQQQQQQQQSSTNVIIITDDDGDNETQMITSPLPSSSSSLLLDDNRNDNKSIIEMVKSSDKQFDEKLNNKKITFEIIKNNEIETQTDNKNDHEIICESENKIIEKPSDNDDGGLVLSLNNETEKNIIIISSNNMSQDNISSSSTTTTTTTITITTTTTTADTTTIITTTTNAATQITKCPNVVDVQNLNKCVVEMKGDDEDRSENIVKSSILIKNDHDRDHGNGDNYCLSDNINKNRKLEQRTIAIGGDNEILVEQQQQKSENDQSVSITSTTDIIDMKDDIIQQEELSPTMEEYQECAQFVQRSDVFEYETDLDTNLTPGCVAPAPTPAPSLAPLAEIEMEDPMEEEQECGIRSDEGADTGAGTSASASVEIIETTVMVQKSESVEETRKRRKKRDSTDVKKSSDEKTEQGTSQEQAKTETETHNAVCPWEDEDVSTSDTTFVKTYATLGYL